jgi:hypothetical protein
MNDEIKSKDCRIFNELWLIGVISSLLFAFPATYWRAEAPWIMTIGVTLGVLVALLIEIIRSRKPQFLLTLLPGHKTWAHYSRILGLFVRDSQTPTKQLELTGLEIIIQKPAKRVIVLEDDKQRKMTLVDFDRFMARVTTVIGEDLAKASEYALRTAWTRLKPLQDEYPQMEMFFRDPMVIEQLKKDIASNAHTAVAKSGEQAVRFFLEEFAKSEDVAHYRISPVDVSQTSKRHSVKK